MMDDETRTRERGSASTECGNVLPRVTIQFCTQCKWMLRAAYFAQELLSTFGNALGEVALQPSTGGTFIVKLYHENLAVESADDEVQLKEYVLWDRKSEGGFPETKELKRRVRDVIDPKRDLGHVDGKKNATKTATAPEAQTQTQTQTSVTPPDEPQPPIPKAINLLRGTSGGSESSTVAAERKFTPMDIDPDSRRASAAAVETIQGGGEGLGMCKPGEDCEDCA